MLWFRVWGLGIGFRGDSIVLTGCMEFCWLQGHLGSMLGAHLRSTLRVLGVSGHTCYSDGGDVARVEGWMTGVLRFFLEIMGLRGLRCLRGLGVRLQGLWV